MALKPVWARPEPIITTTSSNAKRRYIIGLEPDFLGDDYIEFDSSINDNTAVVKTDMGISYLRNISGVKFAETWSNKKAAEYAVEETAGAMEPITIAVKPMTIWERIQNLFKG